MDNLAPFNDETPLKSKVVLLQTQIEASMQTLTEILKEIDLIEGRKERG